jgi:signal transduction histidine kinase
MSHELRTPLNAIIGFTGTMLMKLPGPINDEQEQAVAHGAEQCAPPAVADQRFARPDKIEAGKVELELAPQCRR